MPATYDCIATTTLNSTSNVVNFTNIPQTYTDLVLVASARAAQATAPGSNNLVARWGNGSYDTASNYSLTGMFARRNGTNSGDESGSERRTSNNKTDLGSFIYNVPWDTNNLGTTIVHFLSYSNTTTFKTVAARASSNQSFSYAGTDADVILWRSTSAINQIQLYVGNQSVDFQAGSTFSIYGIKAA